jgi:hypothetical protein
MTAQEEIPKDPFVAVKPGSGIADFMDSQATDLLPRSLTAEKLQFARRWTGFRQIAAYIGAKVARTK